MPLCRHVDLYLSYNILKICKNLNWVPKSIPKNKNAMFSGSCNKLLWCSLSEDIQVVDIAVGVVICVFHRVFRVEVFKIPNGLTN